MCIKMMKNVVTKKTLFVLEVAFLLGILTNIGHPITPAYLEQLVIDGKNFGFFFAAMNVTMLLTAPLWGALGDSKNRKRVICLGLIVYAIGQILFGVFDTELLIICARLISGIGIGAVTVNMLSYINTSSILKDRKKETISSYIVFNVLGGSIGAALGGILGNSFSNSLENVLYIQGALTIIYALFVLVVHNTNDDIKPEIRSKNPFASLKDITKLNGWYLTYLIVLFLIGMCFTNVPKYLDVYFNDLSKDTLFIGIFSLVVGTTTLLTNLFILPLITKKCNSFKTSILFSVLCGVCVFLAFNIPNLIGIFTIYFGFIICKTILEPLTVNVLSDNNKIAPGVLMGLRQSFIALGGIIGTIVAGYIYDFNNILLFNIAALIFIISSIILLILKQMKGR